MNDWTVFYTYKFFGVVLTFEGKMSSCTLNNDWRFPFAYRFILSYGAVFNEDTIYLWPLCPITS